MYSVVVPSLLGSVIAQELAGPSPGHLHSVWRSSVADTLVWGAHEVRSGQPSRFSPLGFQHSLFPRHGLARGAHAGSAQCMAMLEPWPTVSFLSHPPAQKRFPLIRPGKLSGMQASHYFASISLMTSTLVTPSELPVIRQGVFHASRGWTIQVPLDTYRFGQVRQALQGFVNLAGDRISA